MKFAEINHQKRCPMYFDLDVQNLILAVIIGTLAAIVYSLRVLVLMERRIASIETHIERVIEKIMKEEIVIEREIRSKRR
jgi:uncharacterized membrane protein